jgi:uncharacterized membrane protein HdeD (DUF308 family)
MATNLSRNWWMLALRGLAAIVFGLLAFAWPGITLTVLVLFFGVYVLWDGIFALIGGIKAEGNRRWPLVLEGLLGIVAGVAIFLWPSAAALVLILIMAGWALGTGIFEIISAIRLREEIEGEWLLLISGFLSVLLGIGLVIWPATGALVITWMIGAYAIVFGILLLILGFRLRTWDKQQPTATASPQVTGEQEVGS